MTPLLLFVAVSAVIPFVVFRGTALRRYFAFLGSSWIAFALLARLPLPLEVDPYLAFASLAVAQLSVFSVLLAQAKDVRWSPARGALVALLVSIPMAAAMLRTPIDGDEPYYLLAADSLLHDRDLDLRNQYRQLPRSPVGLQGGRPDLGPQLGDPVGPHGELYARQEPFLPFLLIPGYAAAGVYGALATMLLFGALLARSTLRLFEDEGILDHVARRLFPLIAFAPPVLWYATRIWPEVPAAWALVEAIRGVRQRRPQRWLSALFFLVLLKLRFLLIGVVLVAQTLREHRRARLAAIAAVLLAIPIAIVWLASGSATSVHTWRELVPGHPRDIATGLFGLILDGAAGIAFQSPFYLLGIFAMARWRETPPAFRLGIASVSLYLLYLVPRPEWHGGWAPPLRYVVVLMPILALGAASVADRFRGWLPPIGLASAALLVHGAAYPWRLFHIASGENCVGEWLSATWRSDFSRLFPSYIRVNAAAGVGVVVLLIALVASRWRLARLPDWAPAILAVLIAAAFWLGRQPGARIEFEDAHVRHDGGALFPEEYAVGRFVYRGGWIVRRGDALSFLAQAGRSTIHYQAARQAVIDIDGSPYILPATDGGYGSAIVTIPRSGRVELRCLEGSVNLDRMDHD